MLNDIYLWQWLSGTGSANGRTSATNGSPGRQTHDETEPTWYWWRTSISRLPQQMMAVLN